MYKDRRLSDSELVLGSVFVVCVFIGVGLLGPNQVQQTAMTPQAMLGAAPVATNAAAQTTGGASAAKPASPAAADKKKCIQEIKNAATTNGGLDYQCVEGCTYTVEMTGGATTHVVPKTAESQGTQPGLVFYKAMSIFGLGGGLSGPYTCKSSVASTMQTNVNGLNTTAYGYQAVAPDASSGGSISSAGSGSSVSSGAGNVGSLSNTSGSSGNGIQGNSLCGGSLGITCSYDSKTGVWNMSTPVGGSNVPGPGEQAMDPGFNGNDEEWAKQQGLSNQGPWAPGQTTQTNGTAGSGSSGSASGVNSYDPYTSGQTADPGGVRDSSYGSTQTSGGATQSHSANSASSNTYPDMQTICQKDGTCTDVIGGNGYRAQPGDPTFQGPTVKTGQPVGTVVNAQSAYATQGNGFGGDSANDLAYARQVGQAMTAPQTQGEPEPSLGSSQYNPIQTPADYQPTGPTVAGNLNYDVANANACANDPSNCYLDPETGTILNPATAPATAASTKTSTAQSCVFCFFSPAQAAPGVSTAPTNSSAVNTTANQSNGSWAVMY